MQATPGHGDCSGSSPDADIHGLIFLACCLIWLALPRSAMVWPLGFLIPLTLYLLVTVTFRRLRCSLPRLRRGRLATGQWLGTGVIVVASSAVLLIHASSAQPDIDSLLALFPFSLPEDALLAFLAFPLLNAALEELVFRWILFEAFLAARGKTVAVIGSSVLFGLVHLEGYPPGPVGAVLAGIYGLSLALLRVGSGGVLLPFIAHVAADAMILTILVTR